MKKKMNEIKRFEAKNKKKLLEFLKKIKIIFRFCSKEAVCMS